MKSKRFISITILVIIILSFSLGNVTSVFESDNDFHHYGSIYSINVYDYDGDSAPEIALGTERGILIIEYDKTEIVKFPCDMSIGSKKANGNHIQNSIYKGDMKNDGTPDIIFGTFDQFIYYYDDSDFSKEPESVYVGGEVLSSVLADYDQDGALEYLLGTTEGKLEAYSWDGA